MNLRRRSFQRLIESRFRLRLIENQTEQHDLGRRVSGIEQQRLAGEADAVIFLGLVGIDGRGARPTLDDVLAIPAPDGDGFRIGELDAMQIVALGQARQLDAGRRQLAGQRFQEITQCRQ